MKGKGEEKELDFNGVKAHTMEPAKIRAEMPTTTALPPAGQVVSRREAPYQTAMVVVQPRDLGKIKSEVLKEAGYAGDDFYYRWMVNDKKTGGKKPVEGGSIGLGMAVARNFGNCAIDVIVEAAVGMDIFTAAFIDLETGFTLKRVFKQRRTSAPGKYDKDRWADMQFQLGQSKAIRNVVLAAAPRWLVNEAIEKAKGAELDKIQKMGVGPATDATLEYLEKFFEVTKDRVELVMGKPVAEFIPDDLITLKAHMTELKNRESRPEDLFPPSAGALDEETRSSAQTKGFVDAVHSAAQEEREPAQAKPEETKPSPEEAVHPGDEKSPRPETHAETPWTQEAIDQQVAYIMSRKTPGLKNYLDGCWEALVGYPKEIRLAVGEKYLNLFGTPYQVGVKPVWPGEQTTTAPAKEGENTGTTETADSEPEPSKNEKPKKGSLGDILCPSGGFLPGQQVDVATVCQVKCPHTDLCQAYEEEMKM